MTADPYITSQEKLISGAFALVMHLLFFVLLVFGVAWQKHRLTDPVVVDLWNTLPAPPAPKVEAPPPPPVKAPPEPVKPAPKVEPKPAPKPEVKPDIALKEKQERERKAREQALAEKKRQQELTEKKKREEERLRLAALKEQQAKEAEAQRLAREQEEALRKLAAQQAAAQQKLIDEYKRRIADKIKRFIVEPPGLQGNPEVVFDVTLLPGGEVLGVRLAKASAVVAWDNAVERAILKAQPLPLPPDPAMFKDFRELNLRFRPKE